ncbi:hypothetical protein B0H17DRAFT_1190552 [Mycena rosella]|uniref:Uncharacterized protein n=1 Tax=Mycena rosella TaxID=1033263 RepID=A0AAD7MCX0_MYCRO|nr:hypothetical protein B0H17DRAFT_1190552 [Mycena rosella]
MGVPSEREGTSLEHAGTYTLLAHAEGPIARATHAERSRRTQGVDGAPLVATSLHRYKVSSGHATCIERMAAGSCSWVSPRERGRTDSLGHAAATRLYVMLGKPALHRLLNALDMWLLCVRTVHAAVNALLHAGFLNELLPKSDGADVPIRRYIFHFTLLLDRL